jgi:hypothetical protein
MAIAERSLSGEKILGVRVSAGRRVKLYSRKVFVSLITQNRVLHIVGAELMSIGSICQILGEKRAVPGMPSLIVFGTSMHKAISIIGIG